MEEQGTPFSERSRKMRRLPPQVRNQPDVGLLELMEKSGVGSADYQHCVTLLQLRSMERTLIASNRLVKATWALAIITGILAIASFLR
jgi:hypothetical protein